MRALRARLYPHRDKTYVIHFVGELVVCSATIEAVAIFILPVLGTMAVKKLNENSDAPNFEGNPSKPSRLAVAILQQCAAKMPESYHPCSGTRLGTMSFLAERRAGRLDGVDDTNSTPPVV